MSSAVTSAPAPGEGAFGLEPGALQALRGFFDATEGLQRVWVFGSRARDDWRARSDLDLALDAPGWSAKDFLRIKERMKDLPIVYPLDVVHWQGVSTPEFVAQIERDRAQPPAKSRVSKLDSPEAVELWKRLLATYRYELERQAQNRYEMAVDEDFYDHIQWSLEEVAELEARGHRPSCST